MVLVVIASRGRTHFVRMRRGNLVCAEEIVLDGTAINDVPLRFARKDRLILN